MSSNKIGLVLSGGGAKGAYEVGVVKALAERDLHIHAIAGASIGALNGAMMAASPNLAIAANRLEEVWQELAHSSPLRTKPVPYYIKLLSSAGLTFYGTQRIASLLSSFGLAGALNSLNSSSGSGVLSSEPLHRILNEYLDMDALQKGTDLYVSIYPYPGITRTASDIVMAELGIKENQLSEFRHIQSSPEVQQRAILLASAALPGIFDAQKIGDKYYTDGGQGGWRKAQGNTPIQPLLNAGIPNIIVTHLSDGSLWSRHDFPSANIVEIRPSRSIARGRMDLIGFNSENIISWIEQGYQDAHICLDKIDRPLSAISALNDSAHQLQLAQKEGESSEKALESAMARLRSMN